MTSTHWDLAGDALWTSLTAYTIFNLVLRGLAVTGKWPDRADRPIVRLLGDSRGDCRTGFARAWVLATNLSSGERALLKRWLKALYQGTQIWLFALSVLIACASGAPATKAPVIADVLDLAWLLTAVLTTSVASTRAMIRPFAIK